MYFSKATLRIVGLKMENSVINKSIKIAKLPPLIKINFFFTFSKKNPLKLTVRLPQTIFRIIAYYALLLKQKT